MAGNSPLALGVVVLAPHGGRSSAGRALGCGPRCRGFEPRRSPHYYLFQQAELSKKWKRPQ